MKYYSDIDIKSELFLKNVIYENNKYYFKNLNEYADYRWNEDR